MTSLDDERAPHIERNRGPSIYQERWLKLRQGRAKIIDLTATLTAVLKMTSSAHGTHDCSISIVEAPTGSCEYFSIQRLYICKVRNASIDDEERSLQVRHGKFWLLTRGWEDESGPKDQRPPALPGTRALSQRKVIEMLNMAFVVVPLCVSPKCIGPLVQYRAVVYFSRIGLLNTT